MDVRPHIIIMVVSVIVVGSVSAADLETETLLSGLENSEVSIFTTTSHYVYHMDTDKYKPGYVMYTDESALKTSDGNITETIAGHSTTYSYKEGVGEDARFSYIYGFTQISPTRVVVSDTYNHCLRQVDQVTRVTSMFAGQYALTTPLPPTKTPCTDSNITVYTDTHTGTAKTELGEGYTINLSEGTHTYETPGPFNKTCITVVNVINNLTDALTTPLPPTKTPCTDSNITVYTDTNTGTAKTELGEGYTINLSEGTHTYETPGPFNKTCITMVNVINNLTDVPPQTLTCPKKQIALTSPENGLATFRLKFGDQNHILQLPSGRHPYIIKSSDRICNVTLDAEDYRVRRTLELVADYSVDCSVVNSTVTWSLLKDVAQQKYTVIEALCGSACKTPGGNARPVISCDGVDDLQIRWPTDLAFTADVVSVPANIRQALENRIRASGPTHDVVLFGATPPIVYPRKAANGGYVSVSLSTTCINGLGYSEIEKRCV